MDDNNKKVEETMSLARIVITGAAALVAAIAFIPATIAPAHAQAKGVAPLETKGDAAARPWKRYDKWPTRDESKFNTLATLASPPAPKEARKLSEPINGDPAKGAKLVAD